MPEVRLGQADAGSRCARNMVQFRAVAVFDDGLAGRHARLTGNTIRRVCCITGYDILFFWVARMIMMGLKFTGQVPFRQVYLHSLVRNAEGAEDVEVQGHGHRSRRAEREIRDRRDALHAGEHGRARARTSSCREDRILSYRAFANKIWNAARFVFMNLDKYEAAGGETLEDLASPEVRAAAPMPRTAKWRCRPLDFLAAARASAQVNEALEHFRFHEAAHVVYHFFWGDFCDWYIEWVKPELTSTPTAARSGYLEESIRGVRSRLRLLHPFMPFLTEELWHQLPQRAGARSIALERFPEARADWANPDAEARMAALQEIITAARNVRGQVKADAKQKPRAEFYSADEELRDLATTNLDAILRLATLSAFEIIAARPNPAGGAMHSAAQFDLRVAHGADEEADPEEERARLLKEKNRLAKDLESKRARLADDKFRSRAPAEIVQAMESTLAERQLEFEKLAERLEQLGG